MGSAERGYAIGVKNWAPPITDVLSVSWGHNTSRRFNRKVWHSRSAKMHHHTLQYDDQLPYQTRLSQTKLMWKKHQHSCSCYILTCHSSSTGDLFTEAADAAMEAMKGRLANQYYMKAEEAWALMEEE